MNATTSKQRPSFRTFEVGTTVYVVDENLNILAGTVAAVYTDHGYNGYPHTFVTFPTPLRYAGEYEWSINNLRTLEEAEAQVAESKLVRSWLNR